MLGRLQVPQADRKLGNWSLTYSNDILMTNTTKSLKTENHTYQNVNLWCLRQKCSGAAVWLANIYIYFIWITHKYVLNLYCVNCSPTKIPTTQENLPENCLPSVDTSSTQNMRVASPVPLALFAATGLTHSWSSHRCQWKTCEFSFRLHFCFEYSKSEWHWLKQKMEEIQKCFRCFTASLTSSKIASLHLQ